MANEVRIISTLKDNVTGQLGKITDKFDVLGKSKGFQSIVSGVGLGIGASIWNQALGNIVGLMGDIVEGALADEESVGRLTASLQANVKGWNGSTDAIERQIKATARLGFEDDDLRNSLAGLLGATHDIAKAQDIQNVAMDLARFKRISLAEASEALTKVEAGSFRVLKSLGIVLKDGATQTEALAAVEAVAAGQAEKWANTNRGKLLASQIEVNESMEKFGTKALPLIIDGQRGAADAAIGLATALDLVSGEMPKTNDEIKQAGDGLGDLFRALAIVSPAYGVLGDAVESNMPKMAATTETAVGKAKDDLDSVQQSLAETGDASNAMRKDIVTDTKKASKAFDDLRDSMASDAQSMINDYFDPIEERADLHKTRLTLLAAEEQAATHKTGEAHTDARNDIVSALDDEASHLAKLGAKGKLTNKDIDKFAGDAKRNYANLSKDARAKIDAIIDQLRILASFKSVAVNVRVGMNQGSMGNGGARAAGGPIDPGKVYRVGENGPEWFVSKDAGAIIPNGGTKSGGGGMGGMGGGNTVVVNVYPGVGTTFTAREGRRLADAMLPPLIAGLQRSGHLARTGTGLRG